MGGGLVPKGQRVRPGDDPSRHADDRGDRDVRRDPARPGRRRVPVRVRHPADPPHVEADPGDAREHPERRPRLLRAPGDQPGPRPEDLRVGRHLQLHGGRDRGRDPHHAARRLGGRGRDARGAELAARGCVRDRRATQDRDDEGCLPRCRVRRRRIPDPWLLARGRGDDDRRDRGRRDGRRPPHLQPARRRSDDDRGDLLARDRIRPGPRFGLRVRRSVLRRAPPVRDHVRAQRRVRTVRAARPEPVLMSLVAPADVRTSVDLALRGKRHDLSSMVFRVALLGTLLLALVILVILLVSTLITAWPVLSPRGWSFVTRDTSSLPERAGVWQGLVGSLILTGFVACIAIPIGISAAVYLQEYARDTRLNRILIANIRNLGGVPSVVYGILGLVVFVKALRAITGPESSGKSYISGGLTLAVLVMPIMILITMEALRAVPRGIREGAYGVGATRWEVVRSHVLPYAAPGIFTGAILSLARAFGETAPLLLVGAVTGYISTPTGRTPVEILQGPYTALPMQIFSWAKLPAG